MNSLHTLDAFATWQGGFDYYFSEEIDVSEWGHALTELHNLGLTDAADVFISARNLFIAHASAPRDVDEKPYLKEMEGLNQRWRQSVPAVHAALSVWRAERGLEEFGATDGI